MPALPLLPSTTFPPDALPKAVAIVRNLGDKKNLLCSGVPLTAQVTLTAAHCIPPANGKNELAIINPQRRDSSFKVLRAIVHPDFKPVPARNSEDFDLALIESENISPAEDLISHNNKITPHPENPIENGFWLAGFSPQRLGLEQPKDLVASPAAWSNVRILENVHVEAKFFARSSRTQSAGACPGDSGAPVWNFMHSISQLVGIVVQANCEKGDVKVVDIARYEQWIQSTTKQLSGMTANRWAVWNTVR